MQFLSLILLPVLENSTLKPTPVRRACVALVYFRLHGPSDVEWCMWTGVASPTTVLMSSQWMTPYGHCRGEDISANSIQLVTLFWVTVVLVAANQDTISTSMVDGILSGVPAEGWYN